MNPDQPYLTLYPAGLLLALLAAALLTPLAGLLARRTGVVAAPRPDRWHGRPTPLLGGLAIMGAATVVFVTLDQPIQEDRYERFGFLLLGALAMFLLGLYDDLKGLPPYTKLLGQIVAACVLVFGQFQALGQEMMSPLMVPFAIVWIVGVTNAFNLLDNMDGLAAGIATVVGLTIFGLSHFQGDRQMALVSLIVAGAAAGFLVHNFNPARIFMGDSGSLLLGYLLSGLTVMGVSRGTSGVAMTLLLPVVIMALPILDTSLVAILRTLNGRSVAQGGRDHLSHRLVALGLSERRAVVVLYIVAALTGLLAVGSRFIGDWPTVALWLLIAVGIVLFGIYLGQVRIYGEEDFERLAGSRTMLGKVVLGGRYLLHKQQIATMLLDLLLISASLLGAYLLRLEGTLDSLFVSQFARILPLAISVKLAVFLALGVYRTVWRHTGLADAWLMVRACVLGSILTAALVFLLIPLEEVPEGVLGIDFFLLILIVLGSRRSLDLMHHLVTQSRRVVVRVLVVGAGDAGEHVVRILQRSQQRAYRVVAFLDDDPRYLHRTVHGVRVLGGIDELPKVVKSLQVDEVVIARVDDDEDSERLKRLCADLGLPVRDVTGVFKSEFQAVSTPTGAAAATA